MRLGLVCLVVSLYIILYIPLALPQLKYCIMFYRFSSNYLYEVCIKHYSFLSQAFKHDIKWCIMFKTPGTPCVRFSVLLALTQYNLFRISYYQTSTALLFSKRTRLIGCSKQYTKWHVHNSTVQHCNIAYLPKYIKTKNMLCFVLYCHFEVIINIDQRKID